MKNSYSKRITEAAISAALYVILTLVTGVFGLSGGVFQLRLSEALCILPIFIPGSVIGIGLGCFISNIITGAIVWDVVFGSLASLIGALGAYLLRGVPKKLKWLTTIPTIIVNSLIIPPIIALSFGSSYSIPLIFISVFISEVISAGILGSLIYYTLQKNRA